MGPVLDEGWVKATHQVVELGFLVIPQAAKQRHVVGSFEDVNRVDLQKAEAIDHIEHRMVSIRVNSELAKR